MSRYVTDTHALIWHLEKNEKLSKNARNVFRDADTGKVQIVIPSIVFVEMVYLAEKGRIGRNLMNQVFKQLDVNRGSYSIANLDRAIVTALKDIPREAVPDMPDRIIAATAYQLGLPLITRDCKIRKSRPLMIIW